ncbi:hypothetical protein POVCU1_063540 [Plasmodium ovale curtisi]|uniref:Uncharacterized protein n=1 Tax=Plasmodium ovale curtisi TaxID=864141 RepID=A0A1A8XAV1_PLAOA|nr:hypothetical protein POVCU1_063540 [Plasmodium ovale curtisi]
MNLLKYDIAVDCPSYINYLGDTMVNSISQINNSCEYITGIYNNYSISKWECTEVKQYLSYPQNESKLEQLERTVTCKASLNKTIASEGVEAILMESDDIT